MFTHGSRDGEISGEMFGETFYYAALDSARVRELLEENGFSIITCIENYSEPVTSYLSLQKSPEQYCVITDFGFIR